MNLELFEKVKKYIREEPRRLDMGEFFYVYPSDLSKKRKDIPPCGTTACIAGTAIILSDPDWRLCGEPSKRAAYLLEIPPTMIESYIVPLFHVGYWPLNLAQKYYQAADAYTKAEVACEAIDAFIRGEF